MTEQISIIEQNRDITPELLSKYLPSTPQSSLMPMVIGNHSGKSFESEREILYQVLFDMRQDVNELKKLVHGIMADKRETPATSPVRSNLTTLNLTPNERHPHLHDAIEPAHFETPQIVEDDIQDTEEYVEETLSLDEVEKDMIRKALERHHGRRKMAAKDLNISERTLYRKIKAYGLE